MITRQLLAALVGVSLAAGTLGTASAQTNQAPAIQQTAPAKAPTVASKPVVAQSAKAKHKTHVAKSTPRKHLAHRLHKSVKVAQHGKRIRISHAGKRPTKHV